MGYNTKQYDRDADYAKKSTKELIAIRDKFQAGVDRAIAEDANEFARATYSFYNEHLQWLKMKIAERIGK